jgi:2,3-bisphosphoglycerate-independent phosphoglycerate mutase
MKAAEITDVMIDALRSGKYRTLRCNYANGDMVGHTGKCVFRPPPFPLSASTASLA